MTSVMALAWALEPSAESLPAGQARPGAPALLPGSAPAGSLALVGSGPQAVRLRVARAASAAKPMLASSRGGSWSCVFLHRRGAFPWVNPEAWRMPGWLGRTHTAATPVAVKLRAPRVLMDL